MKRFASAIIAIALIATPALADQGMWMPQQMPELKAQLEKAGFRGDVKSFTDLTGFPMGAIVSLGGCSASFVSPQGLVVTNHHCAYGSLQYNSSPQNDLITNGFLAKSFAEEVPASPGSRIFVTTSIEDVTAQITGKMPKKLTDKERYLLVDKREKQMIADCEKPGGVVCRVASFFEGTQYLKITQMEIRDVRLVYAPPGGVGEFGGEVDNWMWPRHTGDWSYLRAYVGRDGKPADYSKDNVPYQPKHHLKISTRGINPGDFVLVAGYPGRTFRYKTASEMEDQQEYGYIKSIKYFGDLMNILEEASKASKEAEIKNVSRIKSLANTFKNNQGALAALKRGDMVGIRQGEERELAAWINADPQRKKNFGTALDDIAKINAMTRATRDRDTILRWMYTASPMLSQANRAYRLSVEKTKKDIDRESGYQERDFERIKQASDRAQRLIHVESDRAGLRYFLKEAAALPADQRIKAIDDALAATGAATTEEQIEKFLDQIYGNTKIADQEARRAMLQETTAQLKARNDAFLKFAADLMPLNLANEERGRSVVGAMMRVRPKYMEALKAWRGGVLAPDANSSLRVTFGNVMGYSPRDAVQYEPQTDITGILEKDTGEEPFNSPKRLLDAARAGRFAGYVDPELKTVPVNFMSNVDTTGGNSGSATLNADAEISGLLFDGNYDAMASDYLFNPEMTRSIHVDSIYMLWVMDYVDGAHNLLREMGLPIHSVK